jgi:hypothetical protein
MQTHPTRRPSRFSGWILFTVFLPSVASTQSDSLVAFNKALEHVVERVAPPVLQVDATGPVSDEDENSDATAGSEQQNSEHSVGSGVVLDPSGYIVTNAHVVSGAISLTVTLKKNALARSGMPYPQFQQNPRSSGWRIRRSRSGCDQGGRCWPSISFLQSGGRPEAGATRGCNGQPRRIAKLGIRWCG